MAIATCARKIVQNLREMHVPNERDQEVRRHLDRCFQVDDDGNSLPIPARFTGNEARGIVVIEPAGGGKTTAIRTVLSETEVLARNPDTGEPRYLELQIPNPASLKSVGIAILDATGMPGVTEKTTAAVIWSTVRHRLGLLGIVVLWLDEAQDLVMAKSATETEMTLRMIKSLMKGDAPVIPILSGTQRLAEMTCYDPQVSRRFSKIWPSDLQHGADEGNLIGLIQAYCAEAGLSADLRDDIPARLIVASRRRFGRAVEMIINAIEMALIDGDETLTIDHFAEAWAMQEDCNPNGNLFLEPDWLSIELDRGAEEYEAARTKRQQRKLERV